MHKQERELDLREVMLYLRQYIYVIIAAMLVGAVIAGNLPALTLKRKGQNKGTNHKTYSATALLFPEIYGLNEQPLNGLEYIDEIAESVDVVANSEQVLNEVAKALPQFVQEAGIEETITVDTVGNSAFLQLKVQSDDAQAAEEICKSITEILPDAWSEMTDLHTLKVVSDVTVEEYTSHKSAKSSTSGKKNAAVGALLGAIFSIIILLAIELFDHSLRDAGDVDYYLETSVLGILPSSGKRYERAAHEAVRNLRTSIMAQQQNGCLLITGTDNSVNVQEVGQAVAEAFVRVGKKTLLVDADLRTGSEMAGLSELLQEKQPLEKLVRMVNGVSTLTSGTAVGSESELFSNTAFTETIEHLRASYDFVIFTAPPILQCADTMDLSRTVQGVVLAVRAAKTPIESAVQAKKQLEDLKAPLLGVAMTDYRYDRATRRDGYYYALSAQHK